jgi:CheY-like chemotaxis protein
VDSEPGRGSRFDVLLPLVEAAPPAPTPEAPESAAAGAARVLLVEDEELVAGVATKMLRALGHSVVVRRDGESALRHYRQNWSSVDLVILDLMMPKMSGQEVFQALREINPEAKVLLCSGYSKSEAPFAPREGETLAFLQKPYRLETLAQRIRDLV